MKPAIVYILAFLTLAFQLSLNLSLPHTETVKLQPGTIFGFELMETPLPAGASQDATIDCFLYSFISVKPITAELYFREWSVLIDLVLNGTGLPQEDAAFGTQ